MVQENPKFKVLESEASFQPVLGHIGPDVKCEADPNFESQTTLAGVSVSDVCLGLAYCQDRGQR